MRFFRTSCAAQKKVFLARNALRILKHGPLFHIKVVLPLRPGFDEPGIIPRKRFAQPMDPQLIPDDVKERWYPQKDYHTMYIGEIVEALTK